MDAQSCLINSTHSNGVTVTYEYDHMGNCISETGSDGTVTMEYSVLGELTEWSDGTLTQENLYDYNGQRIKRTEGIDTDYYFYENGVVSVIEDSSSVTAANVLTNEGGLVGSFREMTYYNYLMDVQGSTTNIIKEDGTLSAAYDYTDFGETTELTGNGFDNQICYTGGIYEESTALYYLNARYYDSEIGRFISQDSFRGELNDPCQWHLYTYCANNPINYVDPSGHFVMVLPALYFGGVAEIIINVAITVVLAGIVYTVAAKAVEKIKNNNKKKKNYYKARLYNGEVYIAHNNSITKKKAAKRIKNGLGVYTFTQKKASDAMDTAGKGKTKAEIHLKEGKVSFYHYHTKKRNGAHMWYGKAYTK